MRPGTEAISPYRRQVTLGQGLAAIIGNENWQSRPHMTKCSDPNFGFSLEPLRTGKCSSETVALSSYL